MTVHNALIWGKAFLTRSGKEDLDIAPGIFLKHILQCTSAQLYLKKDILLSAKQIKVYQSHIQQRAEGKPLAYIIGNREFYGLTFMVNEHVLIPRPETELIVDEVLSLKNQTYNYKSMVDVGTGSGALAVTIKHHWPELEITGLDISSKALEVARRNASQHALKIQWQLSDLLRETSQSYDLIVANLPYIAYEDKKILSQEVLNEPKTALFADDHGLGLYEHLIEQATEKLNAKGMMICEFGLGQSQSMQKICEKNGFIVLKCIKDLNKIDRVVVVQKS